MDKALHPVTLTNEELLKQCQLKRLKRSGPGGQRRNKVETAVQLTHRPSGLIAEASEHRSAEVNQKLALQRLRLLLALTIRTSALQSSDLWKSRCVHGKIAINPDHYDFPIILAEALDHIWQQQGDLKPVTGKLSCTASQLIKLLKFKLEALRLTNELRAEQGLHALQ